MALTVDDVVGELRELIEALDRRAPRVEHAGEASIARDAIALREKAVKRLAEITEKTNSTPAVPPNRDSQTD